ncbi:MAG: hypothetical protein AVDCRST_MAG27-2538, partial [uncultured Craurococcus sp.]
MSGAARLRILPPQEPWEGDMRRRQGLAALALLAMAPGLALAQGAG